MPIFQVSRLGNNFTVLVDGVATKSFATRGEAIKAAIQMKEDY